MTTKMTMLAVALTAISSIALAQDKAPNAGAMAAPTPAAEAPKAGAMEAPKPAPENDMFKKWSGTWRCDGTGKGPDGKEMKFKTTWTWKSALGGHWYTVVYKRAKAGPIPAFEGNGLAGYDGVDKKYSFAGFDNMGGWINLTATDGMSYSGEGVPMGKKAPVKISFVKGKDKKGQESDKMMDVTLDLGGQIVNESCKK
jgi:hypothetical protein